MNKLRPPRNFFNVNPETEHFVILFSVAPARHSVGLSLFLHLCFEAKQKHQIFACSSFLPLFLSGADRSRRLRSGEKAPEKIFIRPSQPVFASPVLLCSCNILYVVVVGDRRRRCLCDKLGFLEA